jgi:hypothetical protein
MMRRLRYSQEVSFPLTCERSAAGGIA